jgi:hypothetical protein
MDSSVKTSGQPRLKVTILLNELQKYVARDSNPEFRFGASLKYHRERCNLTLKEASEGIMAISRLWKIEQGTERLCATKTEQLEAKFQGHVVTPAVYLQYQKVMTELKLAYYQNSPYLGIPLAQLVESDYHDDLLRLGEAMLHGKYEHAVTIVNQLLDFIPLMGSQEISDYLLWSGCLASKIGLYRDSCLILQYFEPIGQQDVLQAIVLQVYLLNSSLTNNHQLWHEKANQVRISKFNIFLSSLAVDVTLSNLFLTYAKRPADFSVTIAMEKGLPLNWESYLMALSHFAKHDYQACLYLTESNYTEEVRWYVLHLLVLDKLHHREAISRFSEHPLFDYYEDGNHLLYYLDNKYHNPKIIQFYRDYALEGRYLSQNYFLLAYYYEELGQMYHKYTLYKACDQVRNLLHTRMEVLRHLL